MDIKKQIEAAHRMGRIDGVVRIGEHLYDEQCINYIADAILAGMPLDPHVAQEMHRGDRSTKVLKKLSKYYKNHGTKKS